MSIDVTSVRACLSGAQQDQKAQDPVGGGAAAPRALLRIGETVTRRVPPRPAWQRSACCIIARRSFSGRAVWATDYSSCAVRCCEAAARRSVLLPRGARGQVRQGQRRGKSCARHARSSARHRRRGARSSSGRCSGRGRRRDERRQRGRWRGRPRRRRRRGARAGAPGGPGPARARQAGAAALPALRGLMRSAPHMPGLAPSGSLSWSWQLCQQRSLHAMAASVSQDAVSLRSAAAAASIALIANCIICTYYCSKACGAACCTC